MPAHNEEAVIAKTVESLIAQNYDNALYDIVVIADNCTDKTVDILNLLIRLHYLKIFRNLMNHVENHMPLQNTLHQIIGKIMIILLLLMQIILSILTI